jgi:hypothetical protein
VTVLACGHDETPMSMRDRGQPKSHGVHTPHFGTNTA